MGGSYLSYIFIYRLQVQENPHIRIIMILAGVSMNHLDQPFPLLTTKPTAVFHRTYPAYQGPSRLSCELVRFQIQGSRFFGFPGPTWDGNLRQQPTAIDRIVRQLEIRKLV